MIDGDAGTAVTLAARVGDDVGAHGGAKWAATGLAIGAGLGLALVAVGATVLTGGLAAPAIAGALTAASALEETAAVLGATATVFALAGEGERFGEKKTRATRSSRRADACPRDARRCASKEKRRCGSTTT